MMARSRAWSWSRIHTFYYTSVGTRHSRQRLKSRLAGRLLTDNEVLWRNQRASLQGRMSMRHAARQKKVTALERGGSWADPGICDYPITQYAKSPPLCSGHSPLGGLVRSPF